MAGRVEVQSWVERYQPEDEWYIQNYWFPTATFYSTDPDDNECNTASISQSEMEVKDNFTAMAKVENTEGQEVLQDSFASVDDADGNKSSTVVPLSSEAA